ncbi:HEAT repeat domain-containing protein [Myxococcus stipitatus]|uniref:HEAT repeat domain-containing protein n=1 Tax=Myxococcus stipitatus TaxID=83455 RepID=UPI003144FCB2
MAVLPLPARNPAEAAFIREMQEEHFSEIEFLLEQRQTRLMDESSQWEDLADLEERLAAHVDAMRIQQDVSVPLAQEGLADGDEPRLMAAVYVLASVMEEAELDGFLQEMEHAAEDLVPVWAQALALAERPGLLKWLGPLLRSSRDEVRVAAVRIMGRRLEGGAELLVPLLDSPSAEVRGAAGGALAQLGHVPACSVMENQLLAPPGSEWGELALAALCLGSSRVLPLCRTMGRAGGPNSKDLPRLLALAGDERDWPLLQQWKARPDTALVALEAMGVLGAVEAIPCLMDELAGEAREHRLVAAGALNLMTGAALQQVVKVPAEDEDDPPRELRLPSTDRAAWEQWWKENRARFQGIKRVRLGKPYAVESSLDELTSPESSRETRKRAWAELAIRSRHHVGMDLDGPVLGQKQGLAEWRKRLRR